MKILDNQCEQDGIGAAKSEVKRNVRTEALGETTKHKVRKTYF